MRLYGTLRDRVSTPGRLPHHPFGVRLSPAATVADLVATLGLSAELVTGAAVNRQARELTAVLQDGDRVDLFPPTAGGGGA